MGPQTHVCRANQLDSTLSLARSVECSTVRGSHGTLNQPVSATPAANSGRLRKDPDIAWCYTGLLSLFPVLLLIYSQTIRVPALLDELFSKTAFPRDILPVLHLSDC